MDVNMEDGGRDKKDLKKDFFRPLQNECHYRIQEVIGEGSYGVVCSAIDLRTNELVAVKRVMKLFDHVPEAMRILRELKFLRLLGNHENIISVRDVLLPDERDKFDDVFIVFDYMPTDLSRLLRSDIPLDGEHVQWIIYQIIRALNYLHSLHIFHRDLKPSNILINADSDIRICDFGLARASFHGNTDTVFWTDYVSARWYRAPELIMSHSVGYSTAIDIWSVGCIFAELLNCGKPLFPGRNGHHQLSLIRDILGGPEPQAYRKMPNTRTKQMFMRLPRKDAPDLKEYFPGASLAALSFLKVLLNQDADQRPSAREALRHPYFADVFEAGDEMVTDQIDMREFNFERMDNGPDQLRALFFEEILLYHPETMKQFIAQNHLSPDALRYAMPSGASHFRQQFKEVKSETATGNFISVPNQRLGNMWDQGSGIPPAAPPKAGEKTPGGDMAMDDGM